MEDELNWGVVETSSEPPADLKVITKDAADLKDEIGKLELALKVKKDRFTLISMEILRTLDLMELDNVRAHGYLFSKEVRSSVSTPKTIEDKKELFAFLESKGLFMEIASVNSQTLNALYKSLAEDAAKAGTLDFKLPGVGEPVTYTNLKLRKG